MSSIKQHQKTNTIRGYHDAQFLICNSCFWCASYLSYNPPYIENCPACRSDRMEAIPISQKESYKVNVDGSSVSMEFWNQVWLITTILLYPCGLYTIMESPESRIVPTEDMNTVQLKISGERFPEVVLEICDNCNWSLNVLITRVLSRPVPIVGARCL